MGFMFDVLSELDYLTWELTHPFVSSEVAKSIKIPSVENKKPEHVKAIPGITTEKSEKLVSQSVEIKPTAKVYYGANEPSVTRKVTTEKPKVETSAEKWKQIPAVVFNPKPEKKENTIYAPSPSDSNYEVDKITCGVKLVKMVVSYILSNDNELYTSLDDEAKQIANAIGSIFGLGKLYKDATTTPDLRVYDPDYENFYRPDLGYDISISYIKSYKNNEDFMKKVETRLAECQYPKDDNEVILEVPEVTNPVKPTAESEIIDVIVEPAVEQIHNMDINKEIIHPITFTKTETAKEVVAVVPERDLVTFQTGFPVDLMKSVESVFDDKDNSKRTYFIDNNGNPNISVINSMCPDPAVYMLDPGYVLGKGLVSVLGNTKGDTWFVPIQCKEIVRKMFNNPKYLLTPDEVQEVLKYYFRNTEIYKYVDMSDTGYLAKLNDDQFQKLGKKLTYIINSIMRLMVDPGFEPPRLRFKNFESVNRFTLISDRIVRAPLKHTTENSPIILEGLTFVVKGDKITQRLNGEEKEFVIVRYGDL